MSKLTSKPKLYLNVFAPVTIVFIVNNIYLMTLETPGYLILNLVSFGLVLTFSILSLRKFDETGSASELVHAPAELKTRNKFGTIPKERFFRQGSLRNAYRT